MHYILPKTRRQRRRQRKRSPSKERNIHLGLPKSVASVIYLDVVNNYTVIQHWTIL